jgi:hypothetical protein
MRALKLFPRKPDSAGIFAVKSRSRSKEEKESNSGQVRI